MHEWALADAVITTAVEESKKAKLKKVKRINIKLGELQQIEIAIFKFALKEIMNSQSPVIKSASIKIEKEPAVLKCNICAHNWDFRSAIKQLNEDKVESIHFIPEVAHVYIRCPKCNSPDFEILEGRGVSITSIEGV